MYNKEDYCNNCKWLEDRSDGKFVNSYRCGLYGYGCEYTHFGCLKCAKCKDVEKVQDTIKDGIEENSKAIDEYLKKWNTEREEQLKSEIKRLEEKQPNLNEIKLKPPTDMEINLCFCDFFEKQRSNKCDGCIFLEKYQDMGMSSDICSLVSGLNEAVEAVKSKKTCPCKLTKQEAYEYVAKRNRLI